MWLPACSGEQGLAAAGRECDPMDSDDRWRMSLVKIETDVVDEPPIFFKTEKDDQGQWWAVVPLSYRYTITYYYQLYIYNIIITITVLAM